jgi:hypothetical protein
MPAVAFSWPASVFASANALAGMCFVSLYLLSLSLSLSLSLFVYCAFMNVHNCSTGGRTVEGMAHVGRCPQRHLYYSRYLALCLYSCILTTGVHLFPYETYVCKRVRCA